MTATAPDATANLAHTPDQPANNVGNMGHDKPLECVIIGSGPAGYTAAIYAARAGLKPVLYTGQEPGGQLMITTDVENFPGFPDGVQGPEMMAKFQEQAERFGTDVRYDLIERVDFSGAVKRIYSAGGDEVHAHTVVVSTGASAKWLGLESEQRLANHGVSACAVCDGFFYKGKPVAVVGGGDTAAEEASYLSKLCPEVHMIVRRDEMRASKIMQRRVMNTPNIHIHWNTETDEILGDDHVTGVRLKNNKTGETEEIAIEGFFVAIGHKPNTDIFKGILDMHDNGYLKNEPGTAHTNVEGVFVCGDAADQTYRQAVTAAGTGCMAALDAERYLVANEIV